jgi:hypothetical protein
VFWDVTPCGGTSVLARVTQYNIPEDGIPCTELLFDKRNCCRSRASVTPTARTEPDCSASTIAHYVATNLEPSTNGTVQPSLETWQAAELIQLIILG